MATWPTIAGVVPRVRRTIRYQTKVFKTDGGRTIRRRIWSSPIYDYQLTYQGLHESATISAPGQPYDGLTERAAVAWMFQNAAGSFGVHTYTEPAGLGGATRTVRFVDDSLEEEDDEGAPWWRVTVTLTTEI